MNRTCLSALACALMLSAGCFRTTAIIPDRPPAETHSKWVHGFFWGAVGDTIDTGMMCGGRSVSRITTERTPGNIALQWITLGVYTPSKISVTCSQPPHYAYAPPAYAPPAYAPPAYPQPSYPPQPYVPPAYLPPADAPQPYTWTP